MFKFKAQLRNGRHTSKVQILGYSNTMYSYIVTKNQDE